MRLFLLNLENIIHLLTIEVTYIDSAIPPVKRQFMCFQATAKYGRQKLIIFLRTGNFIFW
jgi:hypothetical protein